MLTRSSKRAIKSRHERAAQPRPATDKVTLTVSVEVAHVLHAMEQARNAGYERMTIRLNDLTVEERLTPML